MGVTFTKKRASFDGLLETGLAQELVVKITFSPHGRALVTSTPPAAWEAWLNAQDTTVEGLEVGAHFLVESEEAQLALEAAWLEAVQQLISDAGPEIFPESDEDSRRLPNESD